MEKGLIVHAAIINNRKLLILKRAEETYLGGLWDFPGGTLEDGEEPEAGARREVLEETGLTLNELELFHSRSDFDQAKNKQFITLIFMAETTELTIKINPIEHSEYLWAKPNEIKSFKLAAYLPVCLKYLKSKGRLI